MEAVAAPAVSDGNNRRRHKLYTLVLPLDLPQGRVLLGYKRRGWGIHKYNGFGGKVEPGETIVAAAARELEEESGLSCAEKDLQHHGILLLETVADSEAPVLEIHVFVAVRWKGDPMETEEMRPEWFYPSALPLDSMWEETRGWMPVILGLHFPEPLDGHGNDSRANAWTRHGRKDSERFFVHYVTFSGGPNPQTSQYDAWHELANSVWKWYEEEVSSWDAEAVGTWMDRARADM